MYAFLSTMQLPADHPLAAPPIPDHLVDVVARASAVSVHYHVVAALAGAEFGVATSPFLSYSFLSDLSPPPPGHSGFVGCSLACAARRLAK